MGVGGRTGRSWCGGPVTPDRQQGGRRGPSDDNGAVEWLPERNRCWFEGTVVAVRRVFGPTGDRRAAAALERVLSQCENTDMEPVVCSAASDSEGVMNQSPTGDDMLARYDDNGNGRITCQEARRHGIAPARRGHPAYRYMRDGDGDGVVCE